MTGDSRKFGIAIVAAVVGPALAVGFTLPIDDETGSGVVSPFGWPALLAAHLLATLPLALAVGRAPKWLAVVVAVLMLTATFALGGAVGVGLDRAEASFAGRLAARCAWCLAMQAPICAALAPTSPFAWGRTMLGFAVAVAPPGVYAWSLGQSTSREIAMLLEDGRPALALSLAERLADMNGVASERDALREQVRLLAAASRSAQSAFDRARALAMLDRLDEAAALVEGDSWPTSLLLLAAVRQKQRRYTESSEAFRAARAGSTNDADRRRAFDGLAFNARESGDPRAAERLYAEALQELPSQAAHFHFRLGRHHEQGGRPAAALRHLGEAARLDPERYGAAAATRAAEIRRHTPGCFLPR